MEIKKSNDLYYFVSPLLKDISFISHLFSTRKNGCSFESKELNLGLHVGDNKEAVLENRKKLCKLLNIDPERLVSGAQVHGTNIKVVTNEDLGKGAKTYDSSIENVDGLITNVPGIPLFAFYADCTPIYLVDVNNKAIALLHAGWKGTVGNIVGRAVAAMTAAYGTNPGDIKACIGPRIEQCCYEVGEGVLSEIKALNLLEEPFVKDDYISLGKINEALLKRAGVNKIEVSPWCTSCNNDIFFSYRKERGKTGRLGALLMINE